MKNLRQKSRLLTVALGVNGLLGPDGVVPYWSSHLDGAESELIVRSGHEVFTKPEAVREIIRILRLEQSLSTGSTRRHSASHRSNTPATAITS